MKRQVLLLVACAACDGIGAPVVSDVTLPSISRGGCPSSFRTCDTSFPAFKPVLPLWIDDRACTAGAPPARLTSVSNVVEGGLATCDHAELDLTGQSGAVTWNAGSLMLAKVHVLADRPVRLLLGAAAIAQSTFTLDGPVELSLSAAPISRSIFASSTGEAALVVQDGLLTDVAIGGASAPFSRVELAGGSLRGGSIVARQLNVTTLALERATLDVTSVLAVDDMVDDVELRVGTGRIAGTTANALYVARCADLVLANTQCTNCVLRGCADADLLVQAGQTARSAVLGNVTFVAGAVADSVIGQDAEQPTRVRMYGVDYAIGEVCPGTTGVGFKQTRPLCIACPGVALDDAATTCNAERTFDDEAEDTSSAPASRTYDDPRYDVLTQYANPSCGPFREPPPCEDFPRSPRPF